jgi:hypothetical protein
MRWLGGPASLRILEAARFGRHRYGCQPRADQDGERKWALHDERPDCSAKAAGNGGSKSQNGGGRKPSKCESGDCEPPDECKTGRGRSEYSPERKLERPYIEQANEYAGYGQ